jgi:hypothetical protein
MNKYMYDTPLATLLNNRSDQPKKFNDSLANQHVPKLQREGELQKRRARNDGGHGIEYYNKLLLERHVNAGLAQKPL